jgi:beta-lactamase class A
MPEFRITRRALLHAIGSAAVVSGLPGCARRPVPDDTSYTALVELERGAGGRLGVCALDTASGRSIGLRADERFGLCSTFKLLLAAAVLREADAGRWSLATVIPYSADDMVSHAPVTQQHLAAGGMTIGALAEAAQTVSDNVAANLLIARFGGPERVTALFRTIGDPETRLDRYETQLNLVPPGEVRDTTTPRGMATGVANLMTAAVLSADSRERLRRWMIATETGKRRLRAGLPPDWIAGDKTGTAFSPGMPNKHNDVAVIWPPQRAPIVVAAYYEAPGEFDTMRAEDDAVLAEVGRIVAGWMRRG